MRAAFLTGTRHIEVREVAAPSTPDDGLVLKVEACGVCGSDLRRWREGLPPGVDALQPGHEVAGIVVAIGPRTTRFAVGDRLAVAPDIHCGRCYYCRRGLVNLCDHLRHLGITPGYPGGLAEQMVLSGEVLARGIVHQMPDAMDFPAGALAEPCSSVLAAHEKIGTGEGDTVAIIGAGPIGCLLVATARVRGATVYVVQRSTRRRSLISQFGATAIVDASQEDPVDRLHDLTAGLGVDIVICANPSAATQAQAVHMVRKGGKVVLFGGLPRAHPLTTLDGNRIHYGEIEVVGAFSYQPRHHAQALELLASGVIPIGKVITHTFPLTAVAEAYAHANDGEALKVIVEP